MPRKSALAPLVSITLVSSSPRRRELLYRVARRVRTVEFVGRERPVRTRADLAANARAKLASLATSTARRNGAPLRSSSGVALAADTGVFVGRMALGKPSDAADARRMLASLSGRWHEVVTAVAVRGPGWSEEFAVSTRVMFRELDDETISAYVATGEPLDKAGAYGIQGLGALLVERIDGDYCNVVGLPLAALEKALLKHGLTLLRSGRGRRDADVRGCGRRRSRDARARGA